MRSTAVSRVFVLSAAEAASLALNRSFSPAMPRVGDVSSSSPLNVAIRNCVSIILLQCPGDSFGRKVTRCSLMTFLCRHRASICASTAST